MEKAAGATAVEHRAISAPSVLNEAFAYRGPVLSRAACGSTLNGW